ncbi:tripartite tricarboxylate transporter substrate binding protein [Lutibaculum baratangense]|uniref:Uncharacterized protein UPF0065 n=1 Tax=Lutibaculum baratangense AMV1 TaxID=631454 RepID=V4TH06_9HYPH|nr:tripartite tricarboxylate transporter substrate binding protein [Lutibaculum baratangense]ESR25368.1 Uncharacterized protein UPF0065 [Lutibaculum baratangense AMV1]
MNSLLARSAIALSILIGSLWAAPKADAAEEWPTRPITLVVKYSAGGGTDLILRTVAKAIEQELGTSIRVTNMTGGVGAIAAQHVYDQPADGYTWLGFGNYLKHFRAMGLADLAGWRDFETFLVGNSLGSWSVSSQSEIGSFEEFVEEARNNPGKLRVATDGKGGLWHEVMSLLAATLDLDVNIVTYDGGAPATLAVLQNEVDVVVSGLHEHIEFIKAGKLRNLAHFADEDLEVPGVGTLPSVTNFVPEFAELAPFGSMYGIGLRRGTPAPILTKLRAAIETALENPEFKQMLDDRFLRPAYLYGEESDQRAARLEVLAANLFDDLEIAERSPEELGLPTAEEFDGWWPPADYQPTAVE